MISASRKCRKNEYPERMKKALDDIKVENIPLGSLFSPQGVRMTKIKLCAKLRATGTEKIFSIS